MRADGSSAAPPRGGHDPERRRLLRSVLLGSAAAALGTIPGRWARPGIAVGSLPAAAQSAGGDCVLFADCSPADDGECNGTLRLRDDGRVEGRVQACLGSRDGTRIELVQGDTRADFFDATCDPDVLPSCFIPDECTVCGVVGQGSNQFPGASGFVVGRAALVATWPGGGCETAIELVEECDS